MEYCKECGAEKEGKEISYGIINEDGELIAEFKDKEIRDKSFVNFFDTNKKDLRVEVETGEKSGFKVICLK